MKILIFTEGTLLMHLSGKDISREERVKQVENNIPDVKEYFNYVPVGDAVKKIEAWQSQGNDICYLTSRETPNEVEDIKNVLNKYGFPKGELYFRKNGEQYKDVAERVMPDVLIEDDCESIGGEIEMTYPHIKLELRNKIKSIVVKEFAGVDSLPDNLT